MVIVGAEDEEYRLNVDDIDSSLVFMYTPVTEEGTKGEPQYAMTDFVKAGAFWVICHSVFPLHAYIAIALCSCSLVNRISP